MWSYLAELKRVGEAEKGWARQRGGGVFAYETADPDSHRKKWLCGIFKWLPSLLDRKKQVAFVFFLDNTSRFS